MSFSFSSPNPKFQAPGNLSFEEQIAQQASDTASIQVTDLKQENGTLTATLTIPTIHPTENEKPIQFVTQSYKVEDTTFKMRVDVMCKKEPGLPQQPESIFGKATPKHNFQYSFYVMTETLPFSDGVTCLFSSKYFGKTKTELPASTKAFYVLIHECNTKFANNLLSIDIKLEVVKSMSVAVNKLQFNNMYDDTDLIDFELTVDDGSVKVHKFVLAASSAVFKGEFGENWKNADKGHLHVAGVSKTTLENFKRYLYLRQIPDSGCMQLLLLANYYQMPHLERECIQQLVNVVNAENFLEQLEFAVERKLMKYLIALLKQIESKAFKVDDICKSSFLVYQQRS